MIGSALRYPFEATGGRRHLLVVTGALLAMAIAIRIAVELFPLVLSVLPLAVAVLAAIVTMGTFVTAFLEPESPVPVLASLFRTGTRATLVVLGTLGPPVALLFSTVLSYTGGDSSAADVGVFFLVGSTMSLVFFLAGTYVFPVLVARAVVTGQFRGIANWGRLRIALTELSYLQGWSLGLGLAILGSGGVLTGLTSTTLAGLLAIAGGAYCLLASVRVVGKGYAGVPGVDYAD